MNYIDVLLLVVLVVTIWSCILRGFILSASELLTWIGSLILAFVVNKPLAALLYSVIPSLSVWSAPLTFLFSAIIIKHLLDLIAYRLLHSIPEPVHQHVLNKLLGVVPGAINGLLWATFLSAFLLLLPFGSGIAGSVQESRLSGPLLSEATWLGRKFAVIFADALNHSVISMPAKVGKEEAVKLPFTVRKPQVRADLELRMLTLVNIERRRHGLQILKADPEMTAVARKHSTDMFARGYFSHINPDGLTPFDRMEREGVTFLTAGENLALAQTLSIAHAGLMKSPGHRANILNPAFGRLGIGILDGGIYGLMVTQNFRN